jgi:hypothetical protein
MDNSFRIFEKHLDIDLPRFSEYLDTKHDQILSNSVPEKNYLTDLLVKKYNKLNNAPTKLNKKYNIFEFNNKDIQTILYSLKELVRDACIHYGVNFDEQDYRIRGWFNYDIKSANSKEFSPLKNERFFHDHLGGFGVPDFHGYYCVNAEPSITFYKVEDDVFENKNKNNRLIICPNGFPHGRDDWYNDEPRVTIAYDIVPLSRLVDLGIDSNPIWIKF